MFAYLLSVSLVDSINVSITYNEFREFLAILPKPMWCVKL